MTLTIAQKCLRWATYHGDSLAASFRLSGLQQKTPDNRTWCDCVVAR